jgi:hypothetical protein
LYRGLIISAVEDKSPPALFSFEPDDRVHFIKDLTITATFTEPLDKSKLTGQTFVLADAEDSLIGLVLDWQNDFQVSLIPDALLEGRSYRIMIAEFELSDLAGNLFGDSIAVKRFKLIDVDSLGSISGTVGADLQLIDSSSIRISFRNIRDKQSYAFRLLNRTFEMELPAGKYLLSGFMDEDDNGERGKGSFLPYSLAETYFKYDDTISVRARFETAGIELQVK